ncbi:helix-hairpin-helix domain-containing protein [Sansalvadorimonas verongulae]|uniref:helix-hairpin-helix domain-containing protein n=1 Tax=Sansalvadorimonas verongulae TaxID=2172824 RepID=UPI0012BBDD17|nr:helix-hairpin-helix domain-containing protein [Sansalvadorimonas verongulae]MTI15615.1 hypothetical protein [Sansalvadorimonas verongulae]
MLRQITALSLSSLFFLQPVYSNDCPDIPRDLLQQEHQALLDSIQKNNELYEAGKPEISDDAYDALVVRQRLINRCLGVSKPVIASRPLDNRHRYPMGSLNKAEDRETVEDFLENARKLGSAVIVQPKVDGIAVELVYKKGQLIQALTRGQWRTGQGINLLPALKYTPAVPKTIENNKSEVVVRGELYAELTNPRAQQAASPRHYIAGLINRSEPSPDELASLQFFPWQWKNSTQGSLLSNARQLEEWGFMPTEALTHKVRTIDDVSRLRVQYGNNQDALPIPMDGIVLKMENLAIQERLGHLDGTPYWALAWKFPPHSIVSQVMEVNWTVGRTGQVTVILEIQPVELQGVTISSINVGPLAYFVKQNIAIADTVSLALKGAAVPVLGTVILRPEDRKPVELPDTSLYHGLSCLEVSPVCKEQFIARVKWLTGRNGLNLPAFHQPDIEALISSKKLIGLSDIFDMTIDDIGRENFIALKKQKLSLDQALRALGIPEVGRKKSEWLAKHGKSWDRIQKASKEDIKTWLKVSEQEATDIKRYLQKPEIRKTAKGLLEV